MLTFRLLPIHGGLNVGLFGGSALHARVLDHGRPLVHVVAEVGIVRATLTKWVCRITLELAMQGHRCCVRIASWWLRRLGFSQRRDIDSPGDDDLHFAIDCFARLAYTESLNDETAKTPIAFWAHAYFAGHGITRCVRVVTDNGPNDRATAFVGIAEQPASGRQRTRAYTSWLNGKVEWVPAVV